MLKYLDNSEKDKTREIWEIIFKEDTKEFLDYYYTYKNIDNKILCKYVDNNIASMLHLNPYNILMGSKIYKTYYIVAVGTLKEHRKKGYMAEILNKSLNDMYKENIPFTFLRPAKKEIYLPFEFEYIYDHNYLSLSNDGLKEVSICEEDYEELANFTNDILMKKYNVFCLRDYNYIKVLHQEVKSENGDIVKLFDENKFVGYYVYWGIKEKIVRDIFLDDKFTNITSTKPLVMARIVNLYEFFKNFSLKDTVTEPINICLNIKDNIIKENNGIFRLTVSNNSSYIERINTSIGSVLNIDIQDLLSVCFGYKNINVFTNNDYILKSFSKINLLDKVFIIEEV